MSFQVRNLVTRQVKMMDKYYLVATNMQWKFYPKRSSRVMSRISFAISSTQIFFFHFCHKRVSGIKGEVCRQYPPGVEKSPFVPFFSQFHQLRFVFFTSVTNVYLVLKVKIKNHWNKWIQHCFGIDFFIDDTIRQHYINMVLYELFYIV